MFLLCWGNWVTSCSTTSREVEFRICQWFSYSSDVSELLAEAVRCDPEFFFGVRRCCLFLSYLPKKQLQVMFLYDGGLNWNTGLRKKRQKKVATPGVSRETPSVQNTSVWMEKRFKHCFGIHWHRVLRSWGCWCVSPNRLPESPKTLSTQSVLVRQEQAPLN